VDIVYAAAVKQVYIDTARWFLDRHKDLSFLNLVEIEKNRTGELPSWVPDLRSANVLNFLNQALVIVRDSRPFYASTGNSKAISVQTTDPNHLRLKGVCIGTITKLSKPPGNLLGNVALGWR
jgi:hypothetical protein